MKKKEQPKIQPLKTIIAFAVANYEKQLREFRAEAKKIKEI